MELSPEYTVGAIATDHPLSTRVFSRHGIDFCCGGGIPLKQACEKQKLDFDAIMAEIANEIAERPDTASQWKDAPLPELIDHIIATYHIPLLQELPRLEAMAQKVYKVHGDKDPAMFGELCAVLFALSHELRDHMAKEEQILFPLIKRGMGANAGCPISVMEHEHDSAGNSLRRLRELTNGYQPAEGACNTWRALWHGLGALEKELHDHIHLENNILFPRALAS